MPTHNGTAQTNTAHNGTLASLMPVPIKASLSGQ
jgi:hypothetical protein